MADTKAIIEKYWTSCNDRGWETFGSLIAPDVIYECPQTRERVRGHDAYVRFNREFPGDWQLSINRIVGDEQQVISGPSPTSLRPTAHIWLSATNASGLASENRVTIGGKCR